MRLTKIQKEVLLRATEDTDYCIRAHPRTMDALVAKGLAGNTSGFGWMHGDIVELTDEGMKVRKKLILNGSIER